MDKLLSILREINDTVDYEHEEHLIDNQILDSFSILALIGDIEDEFEIKISFIDIIPENFNSALAMMAMIERIQEGS